MISLGNAALKCHKLYGIIFEYKVKHKKISGYLTCGEEVREEEVDEAVDGGSAAAVAVVAIMDDVLVFCHQLPISTFELLEGGFVEVGIFVEGAAGLMVDDVMDFVVVLNVVMAVVEGVTGLLMEVVDVMAVAVADVVSLTVVVDDFSTLAGLVGPAEVTGALV